MACTSSTARVGRVVSEVSDCQRLPAMVSCYGSRLHVGGGRGSLGSRGSPSPLSGLSKPNNLAKNPDGSGQIWQSGNLGVSILEKGYVSNKILRNETARHSLAMPGCVQPSLAISGHIWLKAQPQHQSGQHKAPSPRHARDDCHSLPLTAHSSSYSLRFLGPQQILWRFIGALYSQSTRTPIICHPSAIITFSSGSRPGFRSSLLLPA